MRRLPRLRSLLLLFTLVVLILPLAGLWFLRLYDSALIRQTESELVAQAAAIAGAFKVERRHLLVTGEAQVEPALPERHFAPPVPDNGQPYNRAARKAGLDLAADPVLPPPPDPAPPSATATALSVKAGFALAPVLDETKQTTLAALRLVDRSGIIIATTGDDMGRSVAGRAEIDGALAGAPVSVMRWREKPVPANAGAISRGSLLRVFVALPVIQGDQIVGAVLVSRTPFTLAQAIQGKIVDLLFVGGLLIAIGVALALLISRMVTRPLDRLVRDAGRIADGRTTSLPMARNPGTREVAELSAAVARMAKTLDHRADYIRSFAAHVSHEFKSPLAGTRGAIELLGDHAAILSESERDHFLTVAAAGVDRMERLISRMLDFARADMMRPVAAEPVPLVPILDRLAAEYARRDLTVATKVDDVDVAVGLTEEAIHIVLTNLLDNALRHAGAGAAVTIAATVGGEGVTITIADNGPGISERNAQRIFDPFFTTLRESGGTGLGLPIVRAILSGVGGTIELITRAPEGAAFRIRLGR